MIEKTVLDYLLKNGLRAYMEDPPGTPDLPYYIVQKTSGGESDHLGEAVLAIQSYGGSLYDAALANEALKAIMPGILEEDSVAGMRLNSDYQYNDYERKRYRYQAVYQFFHY